MMKTKKAVSIICIILVLVLLGTLIFSAFSGALAVSQAEIDALKQQQEAINDKKAELNAQISDLQGQVDLAMELKIALDEQNEMTRQEIELIVEQIALYESLVEQKAVELEEAKAKEAEQKEALRVRMRKMEESGSMSYIAILFNATSFSDLLSRLDTVNMIMKRDKELEDAYIAAREHVEVVKAEYEATLADCEEKKVELEAKKAQLEREIDEAEQVIIDLEADIEAFAAQLDQFEAESAAIGNTINQKEAELEAQRQEIINGGGSVVVGTGVYTWPLPGIYPRENTYGMRYHPILHVNRFHAGTDIGAVTGTPILAADSGTVTIATSGGGYGNYVVISHGEGRTTLYAHMSAIGVSAGQNVTKGDVIGYVGSTGLSTGPHLHFEVRVNGVTTDPMSYF